MNHARAWWGLLAVLTLLVVPAEAAKDRSRPKRAETVTFSGFLGDYGELRPLAPGADFLYGYTKRRGILGEYDRVMLDPILVYFHPASRGVAIDPEKLYELSSYFRERLVEEITASQAVTLAERPGVGVLRVRIAITDVELVKKGANIGTRAAGMALGVGFLVPAVDVGGATMECEVLDSVSGERLVAVVDRESGRRMLNLGSMKSMGDAKSAMREWAHDFRANFERIQEGGLPKGAEP